MANDEAANTTPAGAVPGEASGSTVATVEAPVVPAVTNSTTTGTGYVPNLVFNINGNQPAVTPETRTEQNSQSAKIGIGTPADNKLEDKETPRVTNDGQRPEKIERKDGKLLLTQDKLNAIIADEVRKAEERATNALETQKREAERLAAEAAANTVDEVKRLWAEDKATITTLNNDLATLRNQLQSLTQESLSKQAEVETYQNLIDTSIDHKISAWPEEIRKLDPKTKSGEDYSLTQVSSRMSWVTDMDSIVAIIAERKAQEAAAANRQVQAEETPTPEPKPAVPGNGPTPEPQGDASELDAEAYLEQERARFKQKFNGRNFL